MCVASIGRVLHPVQMVMGCATVAAAAAGYVYATENMPDLKRFKRNHPGASMFIILLGAYLFIYLFGSIIVFLFGIALPLLSKYRADLTSLLPG